jgi:hypothetical protein
VNIMVSNVALGSFPFGRPVLPRPPSASTTKRVFILGAYPSALHVAWRPPTGKPIKAMAVDNEPVPFWNGDKEKQHIAQWKTAVGFKEGEWGEVAGVGNLNGSSGQWVDDNVLVPLRASRKDACITDCVDTYFASTDGARRIADTYAPFAMQVGLPAARLDPHPSEVAIATQSSRHHNDRLRRELSDAEPDIVVTLGNAALRVFRGMAGKMGDVWKLRADASYGDDVFTACEGAPNRVATVGPPCRAAGVPGRTREVAPDDEGVGRLVRARCASRGRREVTAPHRRGGHRPFTRTGGAVSWWLRWRAFRVTGLPCRR